MTRDEIRKKFSGFNKTLVSMTNDEQKPDIKDDWTEEEILEAAKRIMKRLNIQGEL